MLFEKATEKDAVELTELTLRSKAFWGYSPIQIEGWRDELTVTPNYIQSNQVFKLIGKEIIKGDIRGKVKGKVKGYYAFSIAPTKVAKLDFLFVEPGQIGQGYGQILLDNCIDRLKNYDVERIVLDADPNAEKFYIKNGFSVIGQLPSSVENRFLPIMERRL